jgi:formylglycine-generating enzyme required for sulfatase activity
VPAKVEVERHKESPVDDPTGPTGGSNRVIRGGSWVHDASSCRSANRLYETPVYRDFGRGLRVSFVPSDKVSTAADPMTDTTTQITNSIGMKLTLIPSGEFQMGSKESAEETAAFFKKTYGFGSPIRLAGVGLSSAGKVQTRITT